MTEIGRLATGRRQLAAIFSENYTSGHISRMVAHIKLEV